MCQHRFTFVYARVSDLVHKTGHESFAHFPSECLSICGMLRRPQYVSNRLQAQLTGLEAFTWNSFLKAHFKKTFPASGFVGIEYLNVTKEMAN